IRAGNTLVGFATYAEVQKTVSQKTVKGVTQAGLGYDDPLMQEIDEEAEITARAFEQFRAMQTEHGMDAKEFHDAKRNLRTRLNALDRKLDRYLAGEYGVHAGEPSAFKTWRDSHQPFHWFVEFYEIIKRGGFDVIIGNPPYISTAKIRNQYKLKNYLTATCSDVYANVLERCTNLLKQDGRSGMIVPLSLTFSGDFDALRKLLYKSYSINWFSSFARIPAALFSADVRVRNTIHVGHKSKGGPQTLTTVLHRWFEQARQFLFNNLSYAIFSPLSYKGLIPKVNTTVLSEALENCFARTTRTLANCFAQRETEHVLHFKKSAYNWLCFCSELPPCFDSNGCAVAHTKFGTVYFASSEIRDLAFLFLNGKIMFAYWCIVGDDFDVTRWMFADFPMDLCALPVELKKKLLPLCHELEQAMAKNVSFKLNAGKRVGNYNLARCRDVTDKSDEIFAEFLGLQSVWHDIELMYVQLVKTNFDEVENDE
ncbi:MAG: Eco57I restriction-modification methylase domain-containing protein, partial [Acidobacteria bacterium]|nr:Eco57I restriction-modification methylase domain-containing protein [Acidobacteriota bacterium]